MSTIMFPEEWKGRVIYTREAVDTLEVLMFMREQILTGVSPESFIGRLDISALCAFIHGATFVHYSHHVRNTGYGDFAEWLRDVKKEFPQGGGWARRCLEECGGDHRAAIMRFLDFVAEFMELRKARQS